MANVFFFVFKNVPLLPQNVTCRLKSRNTILQRTTKMTLQSPLTLTTPKQINASLPCSFKTILKQQTKVRVGIIGFQAKKNAKVVS